MAPIRALWVPSLASVACLLASPTSPEARSNIRDAFFAAYPGAVGTQLQTLPSNADHCGVCHYAFGGAGTRNPYGRALEAALPNFPNNPNGRRQAVLSIQNLDSDGDGYTTVVEVTDTSTYTNTPTFPGLTPANVDSTSGVAESDLTAFLVPTTMSDLEPPVVTVLTPDGGESWQGGSLQSVTWIATDDVGVTSVDIDYRTDDVEDWKPIARGLDNTGSFGWFVHNTPTIDGHVRVTAHDAVGHSGDDESDSDFTILARAGVAPTTLRDFEMPGTQPFGVGAIAKRADCTGCHANYDPNAEPDHGFGGSMMAMAGLDPLFEACLSIAEQDAPSSGDLCLRCHTALGWLAGRSNPTDGSQLLPSDRTEGVTCEFCHRIVDPVYVEGTSPPEDLPILQGIDAPLTYSNGQFVIDPQARRRGPYDDATPPHPALYSPLHSSSDFCGTCHDVSNPVFERVSGADYAPGPLDEAATDFDSSVLLPLERTYSEWKASQFAIGDGVFAPEFAGNLPDGYVSSCQDCHMADVEGRGANTGPVRSDLGFHDLTGGSSWMPGVLAAIYPDQIDPQQAADGAARAEALLRLAAQVDLEVVQEEGATEARVTVTNRTGHKLPTGYPEGRRMWIHLVAEDSEGATVYESGAYDAATGVLTEDADAVVYEAKMGISPALAAALGLTPGESFHFALNDSIYKDNRIPPLGFENASFDVFGGAPVDPHWEGPGPRYPDGQSWDLATYPLPAATARVRATLYYQSTSKEYVEFLRDENHTDTNGQEMYDLWVAHGRAAPVAMAADSADLVPSEVPAGTEVASLGLFPRTNPFRDRVDLRLDLPRPAPVVFEVFDAQGRRVRRLDLGLLPAGPHHLSWDGQDGAGRDAGSGVFWARVQAGDGALRQQLVRLR